MKHDHDARSPSRRAKTGLSAAALLVALLVSPAAGADWPAWRGPAQTGVAYEKGTPDSTKEILWRVPMRGRSTPAIVEGRVLGINLAGEGVTEQERVFALDLATGSTVWEHRFNVFHTDIPNSRVGWANVAVDRETGNVYAHGVGGMLLCLSRDGKLVWSRSLTETLGRISGYGGRTHTPIIDEDRLVISFLNSSFGDQARGLHRYLALDKRTGEMLWWSAPGGKPADTTYSMPVVAVIGGQRLLIAGNADGGVYAMNARTGTKIWGFQLSKRGINSSVVVDGHRVYATHSEENHDSTALGRVVCIDGRGTGDVTKTHEIWRADGVEAGYASPLVHHGRLYTVTNSGILHCFDAKTGKQHWEQVVGRVGKGSPVWADDKIYVTTVDAGLTILRDEGEEAKVLDTLAVEADGPQVVEVFGSPAVSDARVVFATTRETICLGRSDPNVEDLPAPELAPETRPDTDAAPALIQVRPCEVLIQPGEKVGFRAVAFDGNGRRLREVEARWSPSPKLGTVSQAGMLEASSEPAGKTGVVSATLGELEAAARVRIVPEPPIEEDFETYSDGDVVPWWIGVSKAKHVIETLDGSKVLKKLSDNRGPIFNRSRVFITPPIPAGVTVQADVMAEKQGRRVGDVGLINARYRLELMGAVQRLRVVSWVPGPRFEERMDFAWEPGRWYTMKFRTCVEGGKGIVQGKVWPRGESEPEAWTIEAEDPQPNAEGSAGIYAFSMAPLYYDNVRITRED